MSSPHGNRSRVAFDFDGSLSLARQLWALADTCDQTNRTRSSSADVAKTQWLGKYADDFAARISDEDGSAKSVSGGLRDEARGWAEAWKRAMDEQNRRNRANKVDDVRAKRSALEQFGDFFVGDDSDSQVPKAPTASVPQPPSFLPTQHEVRY